MRCFKHFKLNEQVNLHACYNYYGADEWFDWVVIDWGEQYGHLPAKLLTFVDASEININKSYDVEQYEIEPNERNESNIFCLVQSTLKHSNISSFTSKMSKYYKMEQRLRFVPVESIVSTCFIILDNQMNRKNPKVQTNTYQLIEGNIVSINARETWSRTFINQCSFNEL